jgi:hypothetical protein
MIGARQRQFIDRQDEPVSPRVQRAVVQLAEAHDYAEDVQTGLWEFAVEIESLVGMGIMVADLKWLVQHGYVEHAREVTRHTDASRRFVPPRELKFAKRTCFVLTEAGLRLTRVTSTWMPQRRAA